MKHILNRFFDKIYCVTVHNFYDRHELVKKQLMGIDFDWIFSPPPQYLMPSDKITPSEMSLIIGHINCIWNAKINGYKKIAIWEDDGVLVANENEIQLFFDNIPNNWDCLAMANATWANDVYGFRKEPVSEYVNRVRWGNGSGFNAIREHIYDDFITIATQFIEPIDFSYYKIFGRENTYSPSKKYFSDPISMPNEHVLDRVPNHERFLSSRIIHTK